MTSSHDLRAIAMDSIDKLLAEIQAECQQPKTSKQPPKQAPKQAPKLTKQSKIFPKNNGLNDLLGQVKAEFDEADRVEEKQRAEQLKQEALRQEHIRKQKQAQLTKQALEWLKSLDSLSDEGFWFEQFAEKFPTRLDAAIAYLDAMPSNPNSI